MGNTAVIFSNKRHGLQKKLFIDFFFCRQYKVDEITGAVISIK